MKHALLIPVLFLCGLRASAVESVLPNILIILADDLAETKNLASEQPDRVATMKTLLEKLITNGRSTPGATQKNDVEVRRYSHGNQGGGKPGKKASKSRQ